MGQHNTHKYLPCTSLSHPPSPHCIVQMNWGRAVRHTLQMLCAHGVVTGWQASSWQQMHMNASSTHCKKPDCGQGPGVVRRHPTAPAAHSAGSTWLSSLFSGWRMRSHSFTLRVSAAMLALCSLLRWNLGVAFLAGLVLGLPGRGDWREKEKRGGK